MTLRIIFLFLILSFSSFAQDKHYIDSVTTLTKSKTDSVRFSAYSELSWVLKETDKENAILFANKLISEAQLKLNQRWIAQGYNDLGIVYIVTENLNSALVNIEKSLFIREKLGNKKDIASSLSKIANIKAENGEYAKAIEFQLKALKIYEKLNDLNYITTSCNNIGQFYNYINNFTLSNSYLIRALAIEQTTNDEYNIALTKSVMASNYSDLHKTDSAIAYYNDAKILLKKLGVYHSYATACNNVATIYKNLGDAKKSKWNYLEAITVSKQAGDSLGMALYENNLANLFVDEGNFAEAEKTLINSLEISKKIGAGENILKIYQSFTNLYIQKKDSKNALLYFELYRQRKDSVFSKETAFKFSEAQTKYDVEKKDLELQKNKVTIDAELKTNTIKTTVIIAIVFFMLLLIALFYLFFQKFKNKKNKQLLEQENLASVKIIQTEQQERMRIARDLHDSVGQMLAFIKLQNQQSDEAPISKAINGTINEVRNISHKLMPPELNFGLPRALEALINEMKLKADINFNSEFEAYHFSDSFSINIYRIIQELINNTLKFANATEIYLTAEKIDENISISFFTNGININETNLKNSNGIGWQNIKARLRMLNGGIKIENNTHKNGFVLMLHLPHATN